MLIKKLILALGLISASLSASATTYTAVFKPTARIGPGDPLSATELAYRYVVIIDFDAPGTVIGPDGQSAPAVESPLSHPFFAYVKTNNITTLPQPAVNEPIAQLGALNQFPNGNGGYKTRLTFLSGNSSDYTAIDGFWTDLLPSANLQTLVSDNLYWMINDVAHYPDGKEFYGTYFAALESVTAAVPEPAQISMLLGGLAAFGLRRSRGKAVAR